MLLITWWPYPNFFEIHMANMVQLVVLVCSCIWNVFECSRIFLNNKSSKTCIDKDKNFDIQMIFAEFFFILLCFWYKFFCVDTNIQVALTIPRCFLPNLVSKNKLRIRVATYKAILIWLSCEFFFLAPSNTLSLTIKSCFMRVLLPSTNGVYRAHSDFLSIRGLLLNSYHFRYHTLNNST